MEGWLVQMTFLLGLGEMVSFREGNKVEATLPGNESNISLLKVAGNVIFLFHKGYVIVRRSVFVDHISQTQKTTQERSAICAYFSSHQKPAHCCLVWCVMRL